MSRRRSSIISGVVALLFLLAPASSHSVCSSSFLNPVTDVCWQCVFPLKIAGITVTPNLSGLPEPPDGISSPICVCMDPIPRVGIPVSFWEPARLIEVVKDPFCFPSIGARLSSTGRLKGHSSAQDAYSEHIYSAQVHYYVFPLWGLLELLTDLACLEHSGMDLAYISEVDPTWNNEQLAAILSPESVLFANPAAHLACMADSTAATSGLPLDPLFWCMGSWGTTYPVGGKVKSTGTVKASASLAGKLIFKLHRELVLWGTYGSKALCGKYPMPLWKKTQYRIQLAQPVKGGNCMVIGKPGILWTSVKNPPFMGDNFTYILFRKRNCCAF